MIKTRELKPTVIISDAAPLIHLAAGAALHILSAMGRVILMDVIMLEVTYYQDKPFAKEIKNWVAGTFLLKLLKVMLARQGVAATVAVATTRNFLSLAQKQGIIPDAALLWKKILTVKPTANPLSV